jgi:hypothetical protein
MKVNAMEATHETKKNGFDDKDESYEPPERYRNCLRSVAVQTYRKRVKTLALGAHTEYCFSQVSQPSGI